MNDVQDWMERNNGDIFISHKEAFRTAEISGPDLLDLDNNKLTQMGIPVGCQEKMLEAIGKLQSNSPFPPFLPFSGIVLMFYFKSDAAGTRWGEILEEGLGAVVTINGFLMAATLIGLDDTTTLFWGALSLFTLLTSCWLIFIAKFAKFQRLWRFHTFLSVCAALYHIGGIVVIFLGAIYRTEDVLSHKRMVIWIVLACSPLGLLLLIGATLRLGTASWLRLFVKILLI